MNSLRLTDSRTAAGVRYALAGGRKWALTRELEIAEYLGREYPQLGLVIEAGYAFHRRAARTAAAGGDERFPVDPAAVLVFAGAGLPAPGGPLHALAAAQSPGIRAVYSNPDARVSDICALAYGGDPAVSVVTARSLDADAVLGAAARSLDPSLVPEGGDAVTAALAALGPVSLHVVMVPSRWPPDLAPGAVARYGELLPAGSTFALSLVVPDPGERGLKMATVDAALAGGPAFAHTAQDVGEWIGKAGMALHPDDVSPARAFGRGWARAYLFAPRVPGRMFGAFAAVP